MVAAPAQDDGGGEVGVQDMRLPDRLLIDSDRFLAAVTAGVRAEMAGLQGEILRLVQAEHGALSRVLAEAVERLDASFAELRSPATGVGSMPLGMDDSTAGKADAPGTLARLSSSISLPAASVLVIDAPDQEGRALSGKVNPGRPAFEQPPPRMARRHSLRRVSFDQQRARRPSTLSSLTASDSKPSVTEFKRRSKVVENADEADETQESRRGPHILYSDASALDDTGADSVSMKAVSSALRDDMRPTSFAEMLTEEWNKNECSGLVQKSTNVRATSTGPEVDLYWDSKRQERADRWAVAWSPNTASRTVYEAFSAILLLFDAITLPYTLAWSVPEEGFWFVAVWCTRLFWSVDLFISFVTGYVDSDLQVERRLSWTAGYFLRRWFWCDAALVMFDWTGSVFPGLRLMRLARFARLIRQTQRMYVLMQKAKAMLGKGAHLAIDILLLLLILFWMAHMFGCWWFLIGRWEEGADTGATWLSDGMYSSDGSSYEYLTALHWSLTQFTPASMEVSPKCSAERLYNVAVIFLGFVVGSSVVATLTAMMTQYRMQVGEAMRKKRQLDTFLEQENVGTQLARAVHVRVQTALRQGQRLRANQVELLGLVNCSLRDALSLQVRRRQLVPHPFLGAWAQIDSSCFKAFMDTVMKEQQVNLGDAVFREADEGRAMYFVIAGTLAYKPGVFAREKMFAETDWRLQCKAGEFCAEVALWFEWLHLGTMTAIATTELAIVDASSCTTEFLRRYPLAEKVLRSYALGFARGMLEEHSHPSDLSHDIEYHELMFGLSMESRMALSQPLFHQVHGGGSSPSRAPHLSKAQVERLLEEVAQGKNIVGIAGDEMVRFTFVAAIRVYLLDDPGALTALHDSGLAIPAGYKFLAKLGEFDRTTGSPKGGCVLPGGKRRNLETTAEAINRVVENELMPLIPDMQFHAARGRSREMFIKESPTYGVRTCYSRTCFVGCTSDDLARLSASSPGTDFEPKLPRESPWWMQQLLGKKRVTAQDVELQRRAAEMLKATQIILGVQDDRTAYVYAWLSKSEFDLLSDERVKIVLDQWAQAVYQRNRTWRETGRSCVVSVRM